VTSLRRPLPLLALPPLALPLVACIETRVGDTLIENLEAAGLPLVLGQGELKLHFRATLVMPVPIVSANACVSGDTATWEFDQDDLYGRGFEMKASAIAR
jgi:hypothetical protein